MDGHLYECARGVVSGEREFSRGNFSSCCVMFAAEVESFLVRGLGLA